MRCSVVFGVTLRFLVINISSSSPAINTAAYYQRCVIPSDTLAVLHRRPRWQHLPVAALTQAVKPDIGSESRFLPTPPAFDAPVRGGGSRRNIAMPFMTDTHTDTQTDTAWRHRPRLCIASRGENVKNVKVMTCKVLEITQSVFVL